MCQTARAVWLINKRGENMSIHIERMPLKQNEKILINYWGKYINDWKIESHDILSFIRPAIYDIWLYVAYYDEECCGLLVDEEGGTYGGTNAILLLHVASNMRRKGIGDKLFKSALLNVKENWNAGSGTGYWWQGVPVGCGDEFLEKRGFEWTWTSIDLLLDLKTWNIVDTAAKKYSISKLYKNDADELMNMLKDEIDISGWVPFYKKMIDDQYYDKIFIAQADTEIVGCAMLLDEKDIRWSRNFPGKTGGIGCLGVINRYRKNGIGTALAIEVTNELKNLGYDYSYIGYTYLEDWYGKLGYRTVYRFKMGKRAYDG